MAKKPSFNSAFAAARKAGKKTFVWNGKHYNTKLASHKPTPKKAPAPTPRPRDETPASAPKPSPRPAPGVGIAKPGSKLATMAEARRQRLAAQKARADRVEAARKNNAGAGKAITAMLNGISRGVIQETPAKGPIPKKRPKGR